MLSSPPTTSYSVKVLNIQNICIWKAPPIRLQCNSHNTAIGGAECQYYDVECQYYDAECQYYDAATILNLKITSTYDLNETRFPCPLGLQLEKFNIKNLR